MSPHKNSLLRQLLGAAVGAGVAMGIYGVYTVAEPQLQAWLVVPQSWLETEPKEGINVSDRTADPEVTHRIASKTKEIMATYTKKTPVRYVDTRQAIQAQDSDMFYAARDQETPHRTQSGITAPTITVDGAVELHAAASAPPAAPTTEELEDRWDSLNPIGGPAPSNPTPVTSPTTENQPPIRAPIQASVTTHEPSNLPDSGLGIGMITLAALSGASILRKRKSS